MAAVILGWDADRWNRWNYRAVVEQVLESGRFLDRWDVGPRRKLSPGTEAWLFLQGGAATGLIGHGIVVSETLEARHSSAPDAAGRYVGVAFDALLPMGEQIPPDSLVSAVPGIRWGRSIRQPLSVPPLAEPGLRRLWRDQGPAAVDPTELVSGTYPVDAVSSIEVNRYERNSDARRICLAFHGMACAACGFSFEVRYGEIGEGFIHVHHTVPAAMLGRGYELDPVADLVPLCANCHAMAHHGVGAARTVSELRSLISAAGHLRGGTVSGQALEAQEGARRILAKGRD